jgi:hypothetical protein
MLQDFFMTGGETWASETLNLKTVLALSIAGRWSEIG